MAAPELRLNVSLDLGFFRQQLQKLTVVAQSEFAPKLNVIVNKKSLIRELNEISRLFAKRDYRLNVNDTAIKSARLNAQKLKNTLDLLTGTKYNIDIGIKGSASKQMDDLQSLFSKGKTGQAFGGGAAAVSRARAGAAREGLLGRIGAGSMGKSLGEGGYNIPGLQRVIQELGGTPSKGRSNLVAQAKQLVNSVDDALIDRVYASVKDLRMSMKPLRGQGRISAARSAPNINAILDPIAGLTENPRAARRMLRMLPENRISTDILGKASAQAAFYEQVPSARETQRNIKGFDPLLKAIANSFADYAKSLSTTDPWVGKIGTGIADIVSKASTSAQAQKLLPAAGQSSAERMARQRFAGLPPIEAPTIGMEQAPLSRGASYTLNKARRLLGMPIGPVSSYTPNPWAGSASVPPAATTAPSRLLPPAGATSNYGVAAQAQAMAQATQQYGFMRAPSVPPSMARSSSGTPPGGPPGGGGGRGAGFFGGMQFNMPDLPGAGIMRELGQEFGFAAKQVLLFGSAYKALAFIQTFPAQVGEAVGALQSFRNTMGEISPTAREAGASSQFILDIVEKYNVPLQSARDGFVKLYASMQPAGFSGDEIRDLFLGISQTAATFGMSADKVDRVNYAFAQMASKGQVMSEELKGQLGDVLPGAMALFAEAAGFEGPAAITKFSEALEDGAYKGGAMKTLLTNVGIVMRKEFGPGAEGAARTFQGVMNRMQNSTRLLYESFEPVAVGFLNAVVMPMTNGIKTITDGFNAFFTGTAAKTSGGLVFAQELEKLRPSFEGIAQNVRQLLPILQSFGNTLLNIGKIFVAIAGNPFTGFLLKAYAAVLPLTAAVSILNLRALIPLIANLLRAVPAFAAFTVSQLRGLSTLASFKAAIYGLGLTAAATGTQVRLLSTAIKSAFASTVIGVALLGLGLLIEKLVMAGHNADMAKQKMLQFADSVGQAGKAGDVAGVTATLSAEKAIAARMQKAQKLLQELKSGKKSVSAAQAEELRALGLASNMGFVQEAGQRNLTVQSMPGAISANVLAAQKGYMESQSRIIQSQNALNAAKNVQVKQEQELKKINLEAGEDKEATKEASRLNQLLQENLQANNDLNMIGKDELSQLEAKVKLAKQITLLEIEDIKNTEKGKNQQIALNNAQLAYQLVVAQANDEWEKIIQNLDDVKLEVTEITDKILGQQAAERSPLQKALADLKKEAIDNIQVLEKLRKTTTKLGGDRPEAKSVNTQLDQAFTALNMQDPLLAASKRVTGDIVKDMKEKIQELSTSGQDLTTLDEVILKLGDDWNGLSSQVKTDITSLATQIDLAKPFAEMATAVGNARKELMELTRPHAMAISSAKVIGDSFGEAFKGIITGSMTAQQALAGMFQSISDHFADMVAKMIAEWLKAQLIQGFMNIIGAMIPGMGSLGSAGNALMGAGALAPGAGAMSSLPTSYGAISGGGLGSLGQGGGFGGWSGPTFANGGIVSGPTLGLVGEGRYNEAIIPLPDGKSVPVQLAGGAGGNAAPISTNIVVNVKNGQAESQMSGNQGNQLARELEGAVRQVILKEIRPGGLISSSR